MSPMLSRRGRAGASWLAWGRRDGTLLLAVLGGARPLKAPKLRAAELDRISFPVGVLFSQAGLRLRPSVGAAVQPNLSL